MTITYSNFTNITADPSAFVIRFNENLNYWFGSGIVATVFFVLYISLLNNNYSQASSFTSASFVTFIITYLLWLLGMVGGHTFWMFIPALIMSFVFLVTKS